MDGYSPDTPSSDGSENPGPSTPRRASALALVAAGTLAGAVLGLSGLAVAADDTGSTDDSGYSSTVDTADPVVAPEDCPEGDPGGPGGTAPSSDSGATTAPGAGNT